MNRSTCAIVGCVIASLATLLPAGYADIVASGDINIELNTADHNPNNPVSLDFDGFAANPLQFYGILGPFIPSADIYVTGFSNSLLGITANPAIDARLRVLQPGDSIEASLMWGQDHAILHGSYKAFFEDVDNYRGPFALGNVGYLAVQFQSQANTTHFGWIRYEAVTATSSQAVGRITGWAYDSDPGQAIHAAAVPEPSGTLLMLAGSLLLVVRRHRRAAR